MYSAFLLVDFFVWYYTTAIRNILALWMNGMWFVTHFFSMPLLLRTIGAPWKRMTDEYRRSSIEEFFMTVVMNVMSRILGFGVRATLLLCGTFSLIACTILLFMVLIVWVILPVAAFYLVGVGVTILVS